MKKKIKIFDTLFAHDKYSSPYPSKYIEWDRNLENWDIAFFTDTSLHLALYYNDKKKYAWLLESPTITPTTYEWIIHNNKLFDIVFTHNKKLLDRGENYKFSPAGGCWIKPDEHKIYEKSKLVSIIASNKNWTDGHKLRHKIIEMYKNMLDVYGNGYNPIDNKIIGLKDYMFSFAIENCSEDYYFSEKLIDCFVTGTVPVYWGCPSIGKFFNTNGILKLSDIDKISPETYYKMKPYIIENFERAKEYLSAEDYIIKNYFNNEIL